MTKFSCSRQTLYSCDPLILTRCHAWLVHDLLVRMHGEHACISRHISLMPFVPKELEKMGLSSNCTVQIWKAASGEEDLLHATALSFSESFRPVGYGCCWINVSRTRSPVLSRTLMNITTISTLDRAAGSTANQLYFLYFGEKKKRRLYYLLPTKKI